MFFFLKTALVLVSFVALAMAGDGYHSSGYKAQPYHKTASYHKPAPYMKAKVPSYVPQKKAYNNPTYDMAGYQSEMGAYYNKKQYNAKPSYPKMESNYGSHQQKSYGNVYQG